MTDHKSLSCHYVTGELIKMEAKNHKGNIFVYTLFKNSIYFKITNTKCALVHIMASL